jgi:hypothetical protein
VVASTGTAGVRPVPALGVMARFLPLWLAWLVVVVVGRLVCRVAQRIPPVVRLVRHLRARDGARRTDSSCGTLRT